MFGNAARSPVIGMPDAENSPVEAATDATTPSPRIARVLAARARVASVRRGADQSTARERFGMWRA